MAVTEHANYDWTQVENGTSHIISLDEADMTIARAEEAMVKIIVASHDSDFIAILNCPVIRVMGKDNFQVILGRRSAKEMTLAQIVGHDYSAKAGLPLVGWKTGPKLLEKWVIDS